MAMAKHEVVLFTLAACMFIGVMGLAGTFYAYKLYNPNVVVILDPKDVAKLLKHYEQGKGFVLKF